MKHLLGIVWAAAVALSLAGPVVAQESPQTIVQTTTDEVISRVKNEKDALRGDPTKMYNLVAEMIFPHFDFDVMSQFVLGPDWKTAEEGKRKEFVDQFRKLLVRTYAAALLEYSEQSIAYADAGPAPKNPKTAIVRQDITQPSGTNLPVVYRLHTRPDGWKVYDVTVDGVSLVKTYRSSFASIIKEGGLDKLIATLHTKNQEIGQ